MPSFSGNAQSDLYYNFNVWTDKHQVKTRRYNRLTRYTIEIQRLHYFSIILTLFPLQRVADHSQ